MKYRVIERFRGKYSVEAMCRLFEVSRIVGKGRLVFGDLAKLAVDPFNDIRCIYMILLSSAGYAAGDALAWCPHPGGRYAAYAKKVDIISQLSFHLLTQEGYCLPHFSVNRSSAAMPSPSLIA